MRAGPAALLLALLLQGAAGCVESRAFLMPAFRLGDLAVYADKDGVLYEVELNATYRTAYAGGGPPRDILDVRTRPLGSREESNLHRVDLRTGYLLEHTHVCHTTRPLSHCGQGEFQTGFLGDTTAAWAHGATIFQGTALRPGSVFHRLYVIAGQPVTGRYEVTGIQRVGGILQATVEGELSRNIVNRDPFHGLDGTYLLSAASPFPLEYRLPGTNEGRPTATLQDVRTGTTRLTIPTAGIVLADPLPPLAQPAAYDGSLPPGADAPLPGLNATLAEFILAAQSEIGADDVLAAQVRPPVDAVSGPLAEAERHQRVDLAIGKTTVDRVLTVDRIDQTDAFGQPSRRYQVDVANAFFTSGRATAATELVPLDQVLERAWGSPVGPISYRLGFSAAVADGGPRVGGTPAQPLYRFEGAARTLGVQADTGRLEFDSGFLRPGETRPWLFSSAE